MRLQNVVDDMHIKGKAVKPDQEFEVCIQGKFVQTRSRDPDIRAKSPLQMVHTDLAGPVANESIDGYKYVQSFTDDYSNAVFVYFLKTKSDTVHATENSWQILPLMERLSVSDLTMAQSLCAGTSRLC